MSEIRLGVRKWVGIRVRVRVKPGHTRAHREWCPMLLRLRPPAHRATDVMELGTEAEACRASPTVPQGRLKGKHESVWYRLEAHTKSWLVLCP